MIIYHSDSKSRLRSKNYVLVEITVDDFPLLTREGLIS